MGYIISNVRMAKSMYPYGVNMNGCRAMGTMNAEVIDTDTFESVYTGTVAMCRGKIEMMGCS